MYNGYVSDKNVLQTVSLHFVHSRAQSAKREIKLLLRTNTACESYIPRGQGSQVLGFVSRQSLLVAQVITHE